jgi:hypothetical protein
VKILKNIFLKLCLKKIDDEHIAQNEEAKILKRKELRGIGQRHSGQHRKKSRVRL